MGSAFFSLQGFFKAAFTENLPLKAVAAVIAVLFFVYVQFQEVTERILEVELIPEDLDPATGLMLTSALPETVRLRLRGPRSVVDGLKQERPSPVKIAFDRVKPGVRNYYFSEEMFDIPAGTDFVRVIPESVSIKLERVLKRQLPIKVRTSGRLAKGVEFKDPPAITPSVVKVTGPRSGMINLRAIEAENVDIDGLSVGDYVKRVSILPVEGVQIADIGQILVSFSVQWVRGQRMISGLLVEPQDKRFSAEFRPSEIAVALTGPQLILDKLDPSKIRPVVILDPATVTKPGTYRGDVTIERLPDRIKATSIVPHTVQAKITAIATAEN